MSLIIAATDFSGIGKNTVDYACGLASAQKAQLIVVHSYMVPVLFSDVPIPASMVTDTQHDAEVQMNNLVSELATSYPGLDITGNVVYGSIIDAIDEYAEQHEKPLLIVVGNSSAAEINTWPDSTLYDTFRNITYPVLAIPPGGTFKPVKKICFAFDNKHTGNSAALSQLRMITEELNAALHVLNIQPDVPNQDNRPDFDYEAQILLKGINVTFHMIYDNEDIDRGIESFVVQNSMDVLVMIPRKYSFFEGLFHKSHTKALAHHSHIPILALHDANG